ncbi:MAG: flagellar biosynthesis anti-sigma factor FlgM [Phycisphaerae bacterium]
MTNPVDAATQPTARRGARRSEEARPAQEHPARTDTDAVELSEAAQEQIERYESGLVRTELVERVRAQIAAGAYLTDDKLDAVVNRLHEAMFTAA